MRLPPDWYHNDRALGVIHDLAGDRAHRQRAETAATAAPDRQQVAVFRGLNQRLSGKAVLGDHLNGRWLAIAEICRDLGRGDLGQLAGLLGLRAVSPEAGPSLLLSRRGTAG